MLRLSKRLKAIQVPGNGPNAGLMIRTKLNNRNPRNLEMLNLAHRDCGWGVGPTFKERYMQAQTKHKNDDGDVKRQLKNLPHSHGYHHVQVKSTKNRLVAECRHYNNDLIISVSSREPGLAAQLVSPTDIIAHYAVGRLLGVRMQMAGITNCTFPYLSGYTDNDRQNQESQLDFVSGVEDEGVVIESELDENSEWHQVHFTTRRNDQVQSFERGLTPLQVTQNRGDMPE